MGGLGNLRSAKAMKTNLALLVVVLVQKTLGHGIMVEPFTWQDFKGEGLDVKKPQELGCGSLSEDFNLGLPHGRPGCGIHFFEENLKVNRITVSKEFMVRPIKSRKSPWMAPGSIDIDSCGIYGGGRFANMTTATTEMPFPKAEYEPTVWVPGQKVEVTWFVAANHVGGYQFRLCKLKNNPPGRMFQRSVSGRSRCRLQLARQVCSTLPTGGTKAMKASGILSLCRKPTREPPQRALCGEKPCKTNFTYYHYTYYLIYH